MKLGELAESVNWAFGLVLGEEHIKSQALAAVRQFAGWGEIQSLAGIEVADTAYDTAEITDSEWACIKPLYMLYIERENARALEASRGQGVDVYGRTVSEIEQAITQYETVDLPRLAFSSQPESI